MSEPAPPSRRNRTRQREHVLAALRSTGCHPTAAEVHALVRRTLPRVSLGTVYRNLCVLVSEGLVDEVPVASGPTRYDGNLDPHPHFVCDGCGAIEDLDLDLERTLARRLRRDTGRRAHRMRVSFYGLCETCTDRDRQPVR